jgi:hypothetical protein
MSLKNYVNKAGRQIGSLAKKIGRGYNTAWKAGRKKLDEVKDIPVLGQAVNELEKRTGADRLIQAGDNISSTLDSLDNK